MRKSRDSEILENWFLERYPEARAVMKLCFERTLPRNCQLRWYHGTFDPHLRLQGTKIAR
jgi:hypothetical protein